MIRVAPAMRAPCTALMPMPPMPTTTTVSPAVTPPRLAAGPSRGHAAADERYAFQRRSLSTLMSDCSATTACSENVPTLAIR